MLTFSSPLMTLIHVTVQWIWSPGWEAPRVLDETFTLSQPLSHDCLSSNRRNETKLTPGFSTLLLWICQGTCQCLAIDISDKHQSHCTTQNTTIMQHKLSTCNTYTLLCTKITLLSFNACNIKTEINLINDKHWCKICQIYILILFQSESIVLPCF